MKLLAVLRRSPIVETEPFDSPFQELRHKRPRLAEAPVVSLVVKSPIRGQAIDWCMKDGPRKMTMYVPYQSLLVLFQGLKASPIVETAV